MLDSNTSGVTTSNDNWVNLKSLIRTLEPADSTIGRIKDSLEEFLKLTPVYEGFETTWGEYETMKQELEMSFQQLGENRAELTRSRITGCMEGLCRDVRVELAHIRRYSLAQRTDQDQVRVEDSSTLLARYRRIQALLQALLLNMDPSTWDALGRDSDLRILSAPPGDRTPTWPTGKYSSTNSAEVRRLQIWTQDSTPNAVCWVPDTRQTGISRALCAELDATHKLGARFFFSPENRDFNSIIPSISRQLAEYSAPFRLTLLNSDLQTLSESLDVQFEELIVKPLAKIRAALPAGLAVVIDVTNGCGSVRPILDTILARSSDLPVKLFIFSRPEPYPDAADRVYVHQISRECVVEGVEGELSAALKPLGLSELQLADFVQRTGVLFAYAAAAVRHINDDASWLNSSSIFDS